ncbi:helix-turn-helix transcriptional regulator [Lachnospiraceae bacterium 29-84]
MTYYMVGDLIRDARERQNYSQEELSYGICTTSTLSRIENGVQIPGKRVLEGLLQRLGLVDMVSCAYFGKEELERCEIKQQLTLSLGHGEYGKAEMLAAKMEEKLRGMPRKDFSIKMEEQYVRFAWALIRKHRGEKMERVLELLLETIRMTIPDFDGLHIKRRLLTFHEISILNSIGCAYHRMGRLWDGMRLLLQLKEYMEGHNVQGQAIPVKYTMVLQNLSSWMGQEGYYQDALCLCQTGIDYCIKHGKLHTFPMLLFNKACALAELGQYEMSKEYFSQSAIIFQATKRQENAEQIRSYAARHYGMKSL